MDMIYRKEYAVHQYETDFRGLVKVPALFNFLQDCAGEHAASLGVGVLDLFKRNMTWVMSRYHVLIHRTPAAGARLEVTTWPSDKQGNFAIRDFEVAEGDGRPVLSATSSWMIVDLARKRPVRIDQAIAIPYALGKRALNDPFDSLPLPSAREAEALFRVESGHIDWNRHVNNAVYVQWALEAVPPEFLRTGRAVEIEVSYRAEAFYGDPVMSVVQRLPGEGPAPVFLHQILNAGTGAELTRLRTRWDLTAGDP
ncbi:MAG: acyl-ACP thioesterase domain-containing protein [Acidobacteriota bacterium]